MQITLHAILFVKIEIKSAHCLMICTRVPRARFCRVFHYVLYYVLFTTFTTLHAH